MSDRHILWAAEATFGTAVAPTSALDIASEGLKLRPDRDMVQPAGRIAPMRQTSGKRSVAGPLDVYLSYTTMGHVLRALVGSPSTTSLGSGAYLHIFTPSSSYRPGGWTVDVMREVGRHRFTGLIFTAGRLSFGLGDRHFGLGLQCLAADWDPDAGSLPATAESDFSAPAQVGDTGAPTPFDISLSDGSTTWSADSDSLDITATWDRKLRHPDGRAAATGVVGGGRCGAVGKVGISYTSDSAFLVSAIDDHTSVSLVLTMQGDLIGGGIYQGLVVTLPSCKLSGDAPTLRTSGYGNIGFSADLAALYSSSAGYGPVRYELTNSVSSYT